MGDGIREVFPQMGDGTDASLAILKGSEMNLTSMTLSTSITERLIGPDVILILKITALFRRSWSLNNLLWNEANKDALLEVAGAAVGWLGAGDGLDFGDLFTAFTFGNIANMAHSKFSEKDIQF